MRYFSPLTGLTLTLMLSTGALASSLKGTWPETDTASTTAVTQPEVAATTTVTPPPSQNTANTAAYLGIGVDVLPQSVAAQMPAGVSTGEGILVTRFADNSPAKNSGLLPYDILLAYDDTRLIHPRQFIELVQKDKPGREVQLKVLRNGNVLTHRVTLGMQAVPQARNGLSIKQLGKNDYLATIRFMDASGKQQTRQYRGTREQIYYQAYQARDLPPKDREQILYAAGGPDKNTSKNSWRSMFPFGNRNGDNSWSSFFPFGNRSGDNNQGWGSFFPFNR